MVRRVSGFCSRMATWPLTRLDGFHQFRRNHDDQFLLFLDVFRCPEGRSDNGQISQVRNLACDSADGRADQSSYDKRLTRIEFNGGVHAAHLDPRNRETRHFHPVRVIEFTQLRVHLQTDPATTEYDRDTLELIAVLPELHGEGPLLPGHDNREFATDIHARG